MTPEPAPRSCPWYPTRFVGRDAELRELGRRLAPGSVLAVVGPGGVGKTRLVTEVLRGRTARAAFVDAASARSTDQLVGCLLRDLRATGPSDRAPLDTAVDQLEAAQIDVLVLDNLEQLGPDAVPVIERLAAGPRVVVYTSRVALGAARETQVPVEPLVDLDVQVDLFVGSSPRLGPSGFHPVADRPAVAAVLAALDGLPLAIELAAGRLAVLPIDELARRTRVAPLELLRDPSRPEDRGSAVWRSVAWSYELLGGPSADVLEQLAAFEGPFDPALARAVVDTPTDLSDALQVLLAWHLVRPADDGRLEWLTAVRAFARSRLEVRPDRDAVLDRHDAVLLDLAVRNGGASAAEVAVVWAHIADLDAVIERGLAPGASPDRLRRARRTQHLIHYVEVARSTWEAYDARLARATDAGPVDETVLGFLQKRYRHWLGPDRPRAVGYARRLLELATAFGHPRYQCLALYVLGYDAVERAAGDEVEALHRRGLAIARAAGLTYDEASELAGAINEQAMFDGRFDEVDARIAEARALAEGLPDSLRARIELSGTMVDVNRGSWDAARAGLRRGMGPGELRIPGDQEAGLYTALLIEVGQHGGGAVDRITDWLADPTIPRMSGAVQGRAALLAGAARRLALGMPLVDPPRELGDDREAELAAVTLAAVRALDRLPTPVPPVRATDPAARAVRALAAVVPAVVSDGSPTAEAEAALARVGPTSNWLHVVRHLVRAAIDERDGTWSVPADGGWFAAPGGPRVALTPLHARLVAALAADRRAGRAGLDVEALFAAGWPGEKARRDAQANRIRVAVTTLRQRGLTVLGWTRGAGWFLAARLSPLDRPEPGSPTDPLRL